MTNYVVYLRAVAGKTMIPGSASCLKPWGTKVVITSPGDGIKVSRRDFCAFSHGETHLGKHQSKESGLPIILVGINH